MAEFVHLHNHTEYSLLDGASKIKELVARAATYQEKALAITDHGNLFGAIEFYTECLKAGIKPIIGCEVYVAVGKRSEKKPHPEIQEASFHLTLLATNLTGYRNLLKLTSFGYLEGFYYRPRVDKELLAQYNKGLIALSGCQKGEVNYYLKKGEKEKAAKALAEYLDIFGKENFYLEIMSLGLPDEKKINQEIISLAKGYGVEVVATNDCHYLDRDDYLAHDVLLCIQTNKKFSDRKRLRFESKELYFKSPKEMEKEFFELKDSLKNTLAIAERAEYYLDLSGKNFHLPRWFGSKDNYEHLEKLAEEGLKKRYLEITPQLKQRFLYELNVIKQVGFADYFLIVKDIIDFAKSQNIPVGPGRGSAVGSLILYCLGVTDIDPIKYGLVFERFLNPERITLPDIDIDFSDIHRDKVISYITKKYGEKNVSKITTFGRMLARAVIRDVGRVLDLPQKEIDRLAKLLPPNIALQKAFETIPDFALMVNRDEAYKRLYDLALKLEGVARHASTHASGIVIAPSSLIDFVPLCKTAEGEICTQYDMDALALCGLLKMDILGLKTLRVVEDTFQLLAHQGIKINRENVPLNDKKTYQLLKNGKTLGVFQLESEGMKDILKKLKPETFEDIIATIALYRPGPLLSGDVAEFLKRKAEKSEIKYPHPALKEVLKETYGMILYQEQVMQIAHLIADFSLAEADTLRRAMSKKILELMEKMRQNFVDKAHKKGMAKKEAEKIFDLLIPFAGYGFNKSHATGYAAISYLTAFLKANYPKEFLTASLTAEIGNTDKIYEFLKEGRSIGIQILPPDINRSNYEFQIENSNIRYGLGALKGIGKTFCDALVSERKKKDFVSFKEFILRTKSFGNKKSYEALIKAGAFDSFGLSRHQLLEDLPNYQKEQNESLKKQQFSLFGNEKDEKQKEEKKISKTSYYEYEKEVFGFYFSDHPLAKYQPLYSVLEIKKLSEIKFLSEQQSKFLAIITSKKVRVDKNGKNYALLTIEDLTASSPAMIFGNLLLEKQKTLKVGEIFLLKGRIKEREENFSLVIDDLMPIKNLPQSISQVIIELPPTISDEKELFKLKETLEQFSGHCEVLLNVSYGNEKKRVRLTQIRVRAEVELVEKLMSLKEVSGLEFTIPF